MFSFFAKLLFSNLLIPTVTSIKYLWVTVKLKKHLEFLRPNDIEHNYYSTKKTLEHDHNRPKVIYNLYLIVITL